MSLPRILRSEMARLLLLGFLLGSAGVVLTSAPAAPASSAAAAGADQ